MRDIWVDRFKDYQFGLKLIAQNTGLKTFEIDKAAAENPDKKLSDWVVASYKEKEAKEASEDASKELPSG